MIESHCLLLRQSSELKSTVSYLVWPGEGAVLELLLGIQETEGCFQAVLYHESVAHTGLWPSMLLSSK